MSEEQRIAQMLADGKISAAEAERLRRAMGESEPDEPHEVADVQPPVERPRLSRLAVAGALGLPAAVVAGVSTCVLLNIIRINDLKLSSEVSGFLVGLTVLLTGVVISVAALVVIGSSRGQLTGRGLAMFGLIVQSVAAFMSVCFIT